MSADLYPEVFATALLFFGIWMIVPRAAWSHLSVRILVVVIFQILNLKYLSWRLSATMIPFGMNLEAIWMWLFLCMELCATTLLAWHFIVLIKPSDRSKEADEGEARLRNSSALPGVDLFIPTYNEPEEILKRTLLAATKIDYPNYKVWVLDDGARGWLEEMCREHSVSYLVRPDRRAFKAGNLNHALTITNHPLICVVDADFALDPNFLMRTVGLLDAPDVGIVQTPQVFLNPDAIQYNLGGENSWPEAQSMFSDVMQSGRDTWNNAFCYGTSFVVKRSCLEVCGGFPEETITEDLHTTYVLLSHGFKTRFLNERLSSGLATQDIREFVNQRSRWGIGSLQCLFTTRGIFRAKGLSLLERLFFLEPALYHLSTAWTGCLLLAPAIYWWFGIAPFHTDFGHLLVVFGPRMLLSIYAFYVLSKGKNLPFVNELSRVVGLFVFLRGVVNLIVNPRSQVFSVTKKETDLQSSTIYWRIAWPHLLLLAVTIGGAMYQFFGPNKEAAFMRNDVGMMISFTLYTIWLLFFACLTCVQRPIPQGQLHSLDTVATGSMRLTLQSLITRVLRFQ